MSSETALAHDPKISKNRLAKQDTVADIKQRFQNAHSVVVIDYRGINVEQITQLRKLYRDSGVDYVVLKNTLVQRALDELGVKGLDAYLTGPSAFAFGVKDPVAPAKVLTDYVAKTKNEHLKAKGGYVDGTAFGPEGVKALSELPPKEVLIARMMGSLNAPITNFVGTLSAVLRSVVYALDAVRKQKAGE
ncbi:50S ribosomal protein L10 [Clostridia bacterium]|nr:50S ribosomal protein L10 [Clostridia bacterium]